MSAARILYFGDDECHRMAVLELAGYEAKLCSSEPELVEQLDDAAAVLFSRAPAKLPDIQELRNRTNIPFVAFGGSAKAEDFDLVIEPLTKPEEWLERLSHTIQISRELRKSSELIRRHSRQVRCDSQSLRRESEAVRRASEGAVLKLLDTQRIYPKPDK
jgi:hypothetical protein